MLNNLKELGIKLARLSIVDTHILRNDDYHFHIASDREVLENNVDS